MNADDGEQNVAIWLILLVLSIEVRTLMPIHIASFPSRKGSTVQCKLFIIFYVIQRK